MEPVVPDITQLKALSHPVRLRLLGMLRTLGPATASQVARRLGLNSGATSYHLRQLAEHGFIEEAPELGTRRDRWWRASALSTSVRDEDVTTDEGRDATDAFHQLAVTHSASRMQAAATRRGGESDDWRPLTSISDLQVPVTAEQAARIQERFEALVWEVLEEHPPAPGPLEEGQRRYAVIVSSFPTEDEDPWDA
ncbi:helix-turn-helix domain-containing protein [Janibacter terrae]|uniref:Helix-turn-helix domain-containing protein n=1 Tax=Janibacter terrae TaxID=103817 RepID=A0ABZ2FGQ0_9MICO